MGRRVDRWLVWWLGRRKKLPFFRLSDSHSTTEWFKFCYPVLFVLAHDWLSRAGLGWAELLPLSQWVSKYRRVVVLASFTSSEAATLLLLLLLLLFVRHRLPLDNTARFGPKRTCAIIFHFPRQSPAETAACHPLCMTPAPARRLVQHSVTNILIHICWNPCSISISNY